MMNKLTLILLIFTCTFSLQAQKLTKEERKAKKEAKKKEPPKKGDIYVTVLPAISSNPSFGVIYGAATSTAWYMGEPSTTKISNAIGGVSLTTKGQLLISLKSTGYFEGNEYKLDTDWRFLQSSQGTYGLGSGPQGNKLASNGFEYDDHGAFSKKIDDKQMLEFQWLRLYQTFSKRVKPGLYLGLGYHLDIISKYKDNLLNLDTIPPVITSFYAYNEKYGFSQDKSSLSGISLNAIYDTRDNVNSPYAGRYAQLTFRINPKFLGSDKNSTSLWLEYRDYFDLTKNHKNMLAFWTYGSFQTSGTLPYLNLPGIGYDQYSASGRGYTQGRIRGQSLFYTELEYRRSVWGPEKNPDLLGINLGVNAASASNKDANIGLFDYFDPAMSVGLRFMVSPKARTTIDLDYAIGKYNSSGIYLDLNQFF